MQKDALPKGVVHKQVEISVCDGEHDAVTKVSGYVYQQLAITPEWVAGGKKSKSWVLTHLPSGHSFSWMGHAMFLTPEQGIAAMLEISKLRPDWKSLDPKVYKPIADAMRKISEKHGGFKPTRAYVKSYTHEKPLNG